MSRQGIQVEEGVPARTTGPLHWTLNVLMVLKQRSLAERKWNMSGQEIIFVLDFYLCLSAIPPSIRQISSSIMRLVPLGP